MSIRRIHLVPDVILTTPAAHVTDIHAPSLHALIADMKETVVHADGIGLAAPQVGESVRVIVVNFQKPPYALVNATITWASDGTSVLEEGCLSIPNTTVAVRRPKKVTVDALDERGNPVTITASDLLAKILQHEIDHTNGILITDYA